MKKLFYALSIAIVSSLRALHPAVAQSVTLTFTSMVTGLSQPLDIVRPPADADRLFIVQKNGTVRIVKNGVLQAGNFLNISSITATGGEQGLLSLAFHPQHATNRMFWVVYNNTAGDLVLARYTTVAGDTNIADPASATIVTTIPHPIHDNHNGGRILFGTDGFLYWSTGDGGGGGDTANNAQTGSRRLGKMLRLDVSTGGAPYFTAPSSNPFVGVAGFDPLVYQLGLRNPFRWSFDRLNGDMWIGDVGQGAWEEVDYAPAGAQAARDWGWRCREGAHTYDTTGSCATGTYTGYTDPVYEYARGAGSSITGGYVYRGTASAALYGRYVCADYINNNVYIVSPNGSGGFVGEVQTTNTPPDLTGFGENSAGELFAVSLTAGTMYSISATGTPLGLEKVLNFTHQPAGQRCELFSWNGDPFMRQYALEWRTGSGTFEAVSTLTSSQHQVTLCDADRLSGFYRLRAERLDGSTDFSQTVRLDFGADGHVSASLSPNPAAAGEMVRISTPKALSRLLVRDLQGRDVYTHGPLAAGDHRLSLPVLPAGTYMLQITDASGATESLRLTIR